MVNIEQIKFIDKKLLPLFGINNIVDYTNTTSVKYIESVPNFLDNFNKLIPDILSLYHAREFTFKSNVTYKQSFSVFKKILNLSSVLFELFNKKNIIYLRLIKENIIINKYIEMSGIRQNVTFSSNDDEVLFKGKVHSKKLSFPLWKCVNDNKFIISNLHDTFQVPLVCGIISFNLEMYSVTVKDNILSSIEECCYAINNSHGGLVKIGVNEINKYCSYPAYFTIEMCQKLLEFKEHIYLDITLNWRKIRGAIYVENEIKKGIVIKKENSFNMYDVTNKTFTINRFVKEYEKKNDEKFYEALIKEYKENQGILDGDYSVSALGKYNIFNLKREPINTGFGLLPLSNFDMVIVESDNKKWCKHMHYCDSEYKYYEIIFLRTYDCMYDFIINRKDIQVYLNGELLELTNENVVSRVLQNKMHFHHPYVSTVMTIKYKSDIFEDITMKLKQVFLCDEIRTNLMDYKWLVIN